MSAERCPGCGVELGDDPGGARHAYLASSSGCWEAFGELLAREFGDPEYFREHRLTVDAYAAQHPGDDDPPQTQSVAIHLIGLYHALELGTHPAELLRITQQLTRSRRRWPHLVAPVAYPLTVVDVLAARSAAEHVALVQRWARTTWECWSRHHDLVREWSDAALARAQRRTR